MGPSLRAFLAMVAVQAILLGGLAWVVLRDYQPIGSRDAQHQRAQVAARIILERITAAPCRSCRWDVLRQLDDQRWRIQLARAGWRACFDIDPDRFVTGHSPQPTGVRRVPCPA